MKRHNGMRPHDIPILLKIATRNEGKWLMKDIAYELGISGSEVSESLYRSAIAGLISKDKKKLNRLAILDFLQFGIRYVYPQQPGALVKGMATAHSAKPLKKLIQSKEPYVWPYAHGKIRGQAIEPLHPGIPEACQKDHEFYEMMALVDSLRIGRAREQKLAIEILKEKLENVRGIHG